MDSTGTAQAVERGYPTLALHNPDLDSFHVHIRHVQVDELSRSEAGIQQGEYDCGVSGGFTGFE
jgi:hypothetical protein